jgi:nicotinate-nucleotide adenylyltransferase
MVGIPRPCSIRSHNVHRIGVLAGAFNPVTRAHVALAQAASKIVDEILCVVPRVYPHKQFHGATLEQRLQMLSAVPRLGKAHVSEGGLFIDMAREIRRIAPDSELYFVCGRDAAERVLGWEYGDAGAAERMLQEFQLLVAARRGVYSPPAYLSARVHTLTMAGEFDELSASEVRQRIAANDPWEHLVPPEIVDLVRTIY